MNKNSIVFEIIERYNKGEGTISALVKDYGEYYSRSKFNRDIKELEIEKDPETNKYVFSETIVDGQINMIEVSEEVARLFAEKPTKNNKARLGTEVISNKEKVENNTRKSEIESTKDVKIDYKKERKKKTFEIDIDLEQLIRVQAAILNITINDYVNDVLRAAIPQSTKDIIS